MRRSFQKVLVIDDERLDLQMVTRSFNRACPEIEVETCLGSTDAVARITGGETDLVLLDISMPGLTGLEVLEQARAALDGLPPVIVMLSTSENPDDMRAAYRHGAAAYIVKPSSLDGYESLAHSLGAFWGGHATRPC